MVQKILHSYKISFSGLSRETWLLSFVVLVNRCGYMAVPFMSMYMTQSLHRSISDAGLIITLFGVGSVLGAMAGGHLTDVWGFRPVQILSLVVSGIFFVLFSLVTDFGALCILIVFLSFFVEAFKPANNTAIAFYSSPENLTRSYALNRLAMNIGFGFGTSTGGILAGINYHLLFWVDGIVYVVGGLMIAVLLPGGIKIIDKPHHRESDEQGGSPWRDIFFVRFLMMVCMYMICFVLLFRLAPVYWKEEMHLSESMIGILLGTNGLIIALFEMVMIQNLANRWPDSHYIIAGTVFCGLAFLALVVPGVPAVVLAGLAVVLFTIGEMLALPYISTLVVSRATAFNRGKYSASYSVSQAVAQIIGPAAGGLIALKFGYDMLWLVLVFLSMSCALGFRILFSTKTRIT